jgi:hypothetical protein
MKFFLAALLVLSTATGFARESFPTGPDERLTPGTLCARPDAYRYPEKIAYCNRDVESNLKRAIMRRYDAELGYEVTKMDRMRFKIDHFIPLCMGGGNDEKNLWPQHESVYKQTDDLEFMLCEKMKEGKLKQVEAIQYIKRAKYHLEEADPILDKVSAL